MIDQESTSPSFSDEYWMRIALEQAKKAQELDEVPVGAIVVFENQIIGSAGNGPIHLFDPTAHAEILAIRQACSYLKNYRLPGTALYVTLEPCIMCMGAIIHARIQKLIYGADDPKTGAAGSQYNIGQDDRLNHNLDISRGTLSMECSGLLKDFFADRRKNRKKLPTKK